MLVSRTARTTAAQAAATRQREGVNITFPDWSPRGARGGVWHEFTPAEWPQPHRHDQVFRRLSIYVYELSPAFTTLVWRKAASKLAPATARTNQQNCLLRYCHLGWDGGADAREFTGEVPVLLRLLQTATLVTDPAAADAFVVPFTIGTVGRREDSSRAPASARRRSPAAGVAGRATRAPAGEVTRAPACKLLARRSTRRSSAGWPRCGSVQIWCPSRSSRRTSRRCCRT